jgi:hypothetical protein
MWRLHVALRRFFGHGAGAPFQADFIERLSYDIRMNLPLAEHDVPSQLFSLALPTPPMPPSAPWANPPTTPSRPPNPPPTPARNAHPFAGHFQTIWNKALAKDRTARISAVFHDKLPGRPHATYEDVLGPGWRARLPDGTAPCARFHLTGECPAGATCPHGHELSSLPPRGHVNEALDRFDAAVKFFVDNHHLVKKRKNS